VTEAGGAGLVTEHDGTVGKLTGGESVIAERVAFARTFWARFRGLMGRASLAADEGLYIPGNSIHMFFMRFPIDAVFLSPPDPQTGERTIVGSRPALRPWVGLVMPVKGAQGVVELPSGTIGRTGIQVGDKLRLVDPLG
jgi:uncharacterized protein